ncbi:SIR2 family NAD-dependent protein deacylase [Salinisphaera orenii]|uniref:NAD-dependent protein deacylase n=1 Tax=Salinisphaera orenii YIM 95161 TaxID=1051139 RepID=A0A423PE29_9GAMM|nr:NAD-dependent deacylase [Salinisphaera halophila]ROO23901.1 NAD-dependent deacetylase [Salinisphaera halophila YIM 95161]
MNELDTHARDAAVRALADARRILALTGAGISAESGIPTFREAQTGLWARFSPEDLATPEAFACDPERVWGWYRWRRTLIARGGVNAGHEALAALERHRDVRIATQNVDGLHAAAGSSDIAELHGNIWRERCSACAANTTTAVAPADEDAPLPACSRCGAPTRPDIVWFGEMLPADALARAEQGLNEADCVLVVGTSNRVYPAAALVETAIAGPATVIEVNPEATPVSTAVDVALRASASHALPALVAALDAAPARR